MTLLTGWLDDMELIGRNGRGHGRWGWGAGGKRSEGSFWIAEIAHVLFYVAEEAMTVCVPLAAVERKENQRGTGKIVAHKVMTMKSGAPFTHSVVSLHHVGQHFGHVLYLTWDLTLSSFPMAVIIPNMPETSATLEVDKWGSMTQKERVISHRSRIDGVEMNGPFTLKSRSS